LRTVGQGLDAFCTARVVYPSQGREVLAAAEDDYLPRVVACENGAADFQALKAQAVAARSYLYYRMQRTNSIEDGQQDQVYTCGRPPAARHYQAVAETAGEVLLNAQGNVIAAFYVAGAITTNPGCVPTAGDRDPTNTERYVTYNWGKSGSAVTPSTLGHPASPLNRGCQSQNGAHCLSTQGWDYRDILRFYYGMDIRLEVAQGECVDAHRCPQVSASGPSVVSEQSACFTRTCAVGDTWYTDPSGWDGEQTYTFTIDAPAPQCWGRWRMQLAASGRYRIEAHVTEIGPMSQQAPYRIQHAHGEDTIRVSQAGADGWVEVAVVDLAAETEQWVELADNTGEPFTGLGGTRLAFDALRLTPTDAPLTDFNAPPPDPPEDTSPTDTSTNTPNTTTPPEDTASPPPEDTASPADTTAPDTSAPTPDVSAEDTASPADTIDPATATALRAATPDDDCACAATRRQGRPLPLSWLGALALGALWVGRRRRLWR
jgi:hypothetical protein